MNLAYEQLGRTVSLADRTGGDFNKASALLLKAGQAVVTGQAKDDAAVGSALDAAAAEQGVTLDAAQRPELIGFLKKLGGLDYGTYAKGYQVEQLGPNEVRVVPTGAGAPARPGGAQGDAGGSLSGEVTRAGSPLMIRSDNSERSVGPAPDAVVTRDGRNASLGDIREGDRVSVTTGPDGSARRIDASSSGGFDWLRWLPLLLLLPLLGLLAWILGKRRRDSFILERNRTIGAGRGAEARR